MEKCLGPEQEPQQTPVDCVRVLLADHHTLVRQGLRALLASAPRIAVVGEAENGDQAVEQTLRLQPDVVVMEISMPGLGGAEITALIRAQAPGVKVIALSMPGQKPLISQILHAGARGFLLKDCTVGELVTAIHGVMVGGWSSCPSLKGDHAAATGGLGSPANPLSRQQAGLLRLLAEGKNTKQIAEHLGLSPKTVDVYRRRLMNQLQLWSVAELTKYAIRQGLTTL